jgi:hypothetical protein
MGRMEKDLRIDEDSTMPRIELKPLRATVVHVPKQEEYDKLMQLYESGGWKWDKGFFPTDYKNTAGLVTYISTCEHFREVNNASLFPDITKINLNKFCRFQKIDIPKRNEVYKWFRENKPQRGSLGSEGLGGRLK